MCYRDVFDRVRHREVCSGCAISVYVISCMVSSCMLSGCVLSCVVSIFITLGKVRRFVNMPSRNGAIEICDIAVAYYYIAVSRKVSRKDRVFFSIICSCIHGTLRFQENSTQERSIPDRCTLQWHDYTTMYVIGWKTRFLFDNTQKRTTMSMCAIER